jgi:hypothetical protein
MEGFKKCSKDHFYKEDLTKCPYCPENNSSGDVNTEFLSNTEANSENESFKKPLWLGKEVTGDKKYYNSSLSKISFKSWT